MADDGGDATADRSAVEVRRSRGGDELPGSNDGEKDADVVPIHRSGLAWLARDARPSAHGLQTAVDDLRSRRSRHKIAVIRRSSGEPRR